MARRREPQVAPSELQRELAAKFRASWADFAWSLDLPADGDANGWIARAEALEAGEPAVVSTWELPPDARRHVRKRLGNPARVRVERDGTCRLYI